MNTTSWVVWLICPCQNLPISQRFSPIFHRAAALGVAEFITTTWNDLFANKTGFTIPDLSGTLGAGSSDSELLGRFRELSDTIQGLEENVRTMQRSLRQIHGAAQTEVRWELTVETLENLLRPINR